MQRHYLRKSSFGSADKEMRASIVMYAIEIGHNFGNNENKQTDNLRNNNKNI